MSGKTTVTRTMRGNLTGRRGATTTGDAEAPESLTERQSDPEIPDPEIPDPEIPDPEIPDPEIPDYLSTSPTTKNIEPRIETMSEIRQPGNTADSTETLLKDAERSFSRHGVFSPCDTR